MAFLFVYGTLRRPDVQRIILGREMDATADYERIAITLESGIEAFVNVRAGEKH